MKTSRLLLVATLAAAAFGAQADEADGSQFPVQFTGSKTRAEVNAELAQFKQGRVNPWSIAYNPLAGFQSTKSRAQVQAEYLADRDTVAAMNAEDSGSAYLAAAVQVVPAARLLAGQPVNAQ